MNILIPDLGDFKEVEVIDVLVKPGDVIALETPLVTLETEKATMDVPSTAAGVVKRVAIKKGDRVAKGSVVVEVDVADVADKAKNPSPQPSITAPGVTLPPASMQSSPSRGEGDGQEVIAPPTSVAPVTSPLEGEVARSAGEGSARSAVLPITRHASRVTSSYDFDLVVLGAGPGGYTAAFRAADLGMKVALIERSPMLGGVCLNVGCIPSKALLHAAKVIDEAKEMSAHGVSFGAPTIDASKLRDWKNSVVKKLVGGLSALAKQRKIEVIHGTGKFVSTQEIEVTAPASRKISFANCVIAAGSEPVRLPGLPDDPRIIDSTGALELDLPKRLLVIGGGIIGLEMATVYAALGVKVSVVELTDGLIPGCDRDLVKPLEKRLAKRCERIMVGTKVTKVEALKEGIRVSFEATQPAEAQIYDKVLVAVGRAPNGKRINAEAAGVLVNERGFVPVDPQMRTNVSHIFAIGDIVGQPMLAHKASHEGKLAAEVAHGEKRAFDARVIPSVAYTDPEIAWVGMTETEAKARGVVYGKGAFPWVASGRSLSIGRDDGFTKLLFDSETHRVIGGAVVGTNAGELIGEIALAIEMGCDAADIGLTIHPHPTLSETVAFAAEAFEGTLTDLYLPKRK
jgi:dihydrolipoamide dehydrogenase